MMEPGVANREGKGAIKRAENEKSHSPELWEPRLAVAPTTRFKVANYARWQMPPIQVTFHMTDYSM